MSDNILRFNQISNNDVDKVGGKNASLGEMFNALQEKGIMVPDGFATTVDAYWHFLDCNGIRDKIQDTLNNLDKKDYSNLSQVGKEIREMILHSNFSYALKDDIIFAFKELKDKYDEEIQVAVRSSATAEDLPTASFAGQQESFLNIRTESELLDACKKCYASLFTDRAIKYREDNNFEHMKVGLSIGVQKMVRSDLASAGVGFTLDPDTGFEKVIYLTGSWGLGENVVQGNVNPDEFYVFKNALKTGKRAILRKIRGSKAKTMVYADANISETPLGQTTVNIDTPHEKRGKFVLNDEEIEKLAKWCMQIEEYYKRPMDIEWAKDGITNQIYIVQARPETVYSSQEKSYKIHNYKLNEKSELLTKGRSIGSKIAAGKARLLHSPEEAEKLKEGEVLVADMTNPDWDPILKKASAIVTNKGGRTSHAAIVARELGTVAVVGTGDATQVIKDGQDITVSCIEGEEGRIYDGILSWEDEELDVRDIKNPQTQVMLILGDPDQAFSLSFIPNRGVGLMRLEFVINNSVKIHPMALVNFDKLKSEKTRLRIEELTHEYENKEEYFIDKLSQGIATISAAFFPNEVIVRMSDFKTNEYASLIGGDEFEAGEDNPMLGFRGASRYYNPLYKEGFRLECETIKRVRNDMGFSNVKIMIPFCRTEEEAKKVVEVLEEFGLKRGDNGLEIYMMVEIPSNVILADKFAKYFDGFSIGSNDLTQLTLGIDRDSQIVSNLFNENDEATKILIAQAIKHAKEAGIKIGLCGQAPSDYPEFAQFLVEQGIDSISFNPDAIFEGIKNINEAEERLHITSS